MYLYTFIYIYKYACSKRMRKYSSYIYIQPICIGASVYILCSNARGSNCRRWRGVFSSRTLYYNVGKYNGNVDSLRTRGRDK